METWFIAHSGGFDVSITDPESRVLQIQGPASIDIMRDASGGAITDEMPTFEPVISTWVARTFMYREPALPANWVFEIYCDGGSTDHLALWDHLMAAGQPHGMEFSSTRAMTTRRIEAGILGNATDMDMTVTPFEVGLAAFIDLAKGDFVGRDALLGADQRSLLAGLTCQTEIPTSGSTILDADKSVGFISAGVPSPTLACGIGYA